MRNPNGQSGFTLIEIMVVVFIIGLLAAMVVPKVIGNTDKARVARAKSDIRAIEDAAGLYKLDNGRYPTSIESLTQPGKNNPDGYLPRVPTDPWGNAYVLNSDGRQILIRCMGADGSDGGDGYDQDISSANL